MKLTFLGTRGNIQAKTNRHRRHSAIQITHKKTNIIIDWGLDWLNWPKNSKKFSFCTCKTLTDKPCCCDTSTTKSCTCTCLDNIDAIFITHAHPDHAEGLKYGAPCPVYATPQTWEIIKNYPITNRITLTPYKTVKIGELKSGCLTVQAFPVIHSLNAPAVGYKISDGKSTIFYVPDLVEIVQQHKALAGVNLYIGDGASITRPIIKKRGEARIGHTTISNQIKWCAHEGVKNAIFTHCGSQIVQGDGRKLGTKIRKMGRKLGVKIKVAYDWLLLNV